MEKHIRNQAITEAYEAGEPLAALAERFGLKPASIKQILKDFEFYTRIRASKRFPMVSHWWPPSQLCKPSASGRRLLISMKS
jgi:hypothetical protein